jgi:hypothetical protein
MRNVYFAPLTPKKQSRVARWFARHFRRGGSKKFHSSQAPGEWKNAFEYRKSATVKRKFKKTVVLSVVLLSVAGAWFFLLLWLPYFYVTSFTVTGTERVAPEEIRATVQSFLDSTQLFLFPQKNYFLVTQARVQELLVKKFPLESVTVNKQFPDHMEIQIQEKGRSFIYADGKNYFYLDAQGKILETARGMHADETRVFMNDATTTTIPFPLKDEPLTRYGNLPLVYDAQRVLMHNDIIDEAPAAALQRAHQELAARMGGWQVHYTAVDEKKSEFVTTYVVRDAALLRIQYSLKTPPDELWQKFGKLWVEAQGSAHSYIDLRFLPRAFYK